MESSIPLFANLVLHDPSVPPAADISESGAYMKLILECGSPAAPSSKTMHIYAQSDVSGSMGDKCNDMRTKMQHIIHVWSNIIRYFANHPEHTVYLQLNGFDDEIHPIFQLTQITKENETRLIQAVEAMYPMNTTNIQLALESLRDDLLSRGDADADADADVDADADADADVDADVDVKKCLLMMTDGVVNSGENDPKKLSHILPCDSRAAFIGFGTSHNAVLMNNLGMMGVNTSNWLVNEMEYSSDVYAEIISKWTNEMFENVIVKIEKGLLYDWKTSTWVCELAMGNMSAQEKKTIHIKTSTPNDVIIRVCIGLGGEVIVSQFDPNNVADLTHYMFRLCVQKLMHEVKEFGDENIEFNVPSPARIQRTNDMPMPPQRPNIIPLPRSNAMHLDYDSQSQIPDDFFSFDTPKESEWEKKNRECNERLEKLLHTMEKYVSDAGPEIDLDVDKKNFMTSLINDIKITINHFGRPSQFMYISARSASNGRQQTQTINDDDEDFGRINQAYATPNVLEMMREMSTVTSSTRKKA